MYNILTAVRLTTLLGLSFATTSAYGGTFVYLAINTQAQVGTTSTFGGGSATISSTSNVSSILPYATMTADSNAQASRTGIGVTSGGATVYRKTSFIIHWKQAYLGEPTPGGIYHHHKYDATAEAAYSVSSGTSFQVLSANGYIICPAGGGTGSSVAYPGPTMDADTNTVKQSFSFIPTWTYVGTDPNGLITYSTLSPDINSAESKAAAQVQPKNVSSSAYCTGGSAHTDNFYFSESPVSAW